MMDEPDHGAYRRLLAGRFTPKSVQAKLQPYIDRIVTEHLDAIEAAGATGEPVDLIEHLALPIPCLVICEILGVPYADRDRFHHATEVMMDVSKSRAERDEGGRWLQNYITGLVAAKRSDPESTGLLADLIRTSEQDGSILTDKDLIDIGVLLLFAGHDTTMAMIGLSVLTLLTHPKQRQDLADHPEKIGPAVEELLRYLTIVQFGLGRTAKEDLEIGRQAIAKGDLVVVAMPAANRDPRAFDNPDELDFDRKITRHLAFGYGVHQCLGQNVARAELKTILPRLFQRFPGLKLATPLEEVEMDTYGTNYGVRKMLVTW
jgi:cytochrome P450